MQAKVELNNVYQSTSWLVTVPLRFVGALFKTVACRVRLIISKSMRSIYHNIPTADERKFQLKTFCYEHFAFLIRGTKSYQHWQMNRNTLKEDASACSSGNPEKKNDTLSAEDAVRMMKYLGNHKMTVTAFVPYNFIPQTFAEACES